MKDVSREPSAKAAFALDTPTDLETKKVAAVAEALNKLVADSYVLYAKTKNFHWHMSGPHFRDYHLLLDEQADQIFASIDPLAERVRKLGHRTIRSLKETLSLTSLKESTADFVPPADMLMQLITDNREYLKNLRDAHDVCDDAEDCASTSQLEIYIDETERRIWFLFETSRRATDGGH